LIDERKVIKGIYQSREDIFALEIKKPILAEAKPKVLVILLITKIFLCLLVKDKNEKLPKPK
mgnify:CR=1